MLIFSLLVLGALAVENPFLILAADPSTPAAQATVVVGPLAQGRNSNIVEVRLPNGLKALLLENHTVPLVSVWSWYRVGSKDEQVGETGISHWVEHLNFQGVRNSSNAPIKSLFEESGGYWSGYTFLDQTAFFETLPSNWLEPALQLEAERMSLPQFDLHDVDATRSIILAEQQGAANNPRGLLDVEVTAAAIKMHPYRWPTVGWLSDLRAMTAGQLDRYYRQYYIPNNAVLVVAGDIDPVKTAELVRKYFASALRKPDPPRITAVEPAQEGERRIKIVREGTTPYLEVAFHATDILNDEFYSLLILDAALSGARGLNLWSGPLEASAGKTSRLYRALVDKRLASSIQTSLLPTWHPYLYKVTLTLPDVGQFQAAEEALNDELEKIKTYGLSDYELQKAKNQLIARNFLDQDTLTKRAHQVGFFESIASQTLLDSIEEKLSRVTPDDLRRVAIKYFNEKNRTVGSFIPRAKEEKVEVEQLSSAKSIQPASDGGNGAGEMASGQSPAKESNWPALVRPGYADAGQPITAQASAAALQPPRVKLEPARKVLPNGAVVLAVENPGASTLTIRAAVKAGAMRDSDDTAGIAYLVGKMLERGTRTKSASQLAETFEFVGAELNVETSYLATTVTVNCLKKDGAAVLKAVGEMLQAPAFVPAEVEKVRGNIHTQLQEEADSPEAVADRIMRERLYPAGHPFRRRIKGTIGAVDGLKLQALKDFYARYYRPDQLTLAIAGDVTPEEAAAMAEAGFGSWHVTGDPPAYWMPPVARGLGAGRQIITMDNKSQCQILLGMPGISIYDSNYHAFLILNYILGRAGTGGRIGARLQNEAGLASSFKTSLDASLAAGPFVVQVGASPQNVDRVVALVQDEITQIKQNAVTPEELARAKRFLINAMPMELESNEGITAELIRIELSQLGEDYLSRFANLIEAVTMDNMMDCWRTQLEFDKAALVIAGPYPVRGK